MKTKLLFICSRNRWRSPTAEALFKNHPRSDARSAGITDRARIKVTDCHIGWADMIFCMERKHADRLREQFAEEIRRQAPDHTPHSRRLRVHGSRFDRITARRACRSSGILKSIRCPNPATLSRLTLQKSPPSTKRRNVFRSFERSGLANETFHARSIGQLQRTNAKRRRDRGDKRTECSS